MTVTDKMVDAAMPWLVHWQHMRKTDRQEAVRRAIEAALSLQYSKVTGKQE